MEVSPLQSVKRYQYNHCKGFSFPWQWMCNRWLSPMKHCISLIDWYGQSEEISVQLVKGKKFSCQSEKSWARKPDTNVYQMHPPGCKTAWATIHHGPFKVWWTKNYPTFGKCLWKPRIANHSLGCHDSRAVYFTTSNLGASPKFFLTSWKKPSSSLFRRFARCRLKKLNMLPAGSIFM